MWKLKSEVLHKHGQLSCCCCSCSYQWTVSAPPVPGLSHHPTHLLIRESSQTRLFGDTTCLQSALQSHIAPKADRTEDCQVRKNPSHGQVLLATHEARATHTNSRVHNRCAREKRELLQDRQLSTWYGLLACSIANKRSLAWKTLAAY